MSIRLWHIAVFVLALAAFGVARAPMAVFVPKGQGFTYSRVEGTIWSARFEGARVGPLDAGALTWRLSFLDLAQGRFLGDVRMEGGDLTGDVRLLANANGDRRILTQSLQLTEPAIGGLRLTGAMTAANLDLFFIGRACETAQSTIGTDILARNEAALHWRGPMLTGRSGCEGQEAHLDLAPTETGEPVRISVTFRGDGSGAWRAQAPQDSQDAVMALSQAGFTYAMENGAVIARGDFRWFPF